MKLFGKKIEGPNVETIIIPRGNDNPIIFKAEAVLDMSPFETMCPIPNPPTLFKRGIGMVPDADDSNYKLALEQYAKKRYAYIIITSLKATEGLEWESIVYEQPDTWLNYEKELKDSGFSEWELSRIIVGVMTANCLNESKLEEARKLFLLSQEIPSNGSSYQREGQQNTQSGVPVKDIKLHHQE